MSARGVEIVRGRFDSTELDVASVIAAGARAERVSLVMEDQALPGGRRARVLPRASELPALAAHLRGQRRPFTCYLTLPHGALPQVDSIVEALTATRVEPITGVRVSWSFAGCGLGIGLHADAFDSALVQLAGRRRWELWPPDALPRDYLARLATGEPQGPFDAASPCTSAHPIEPGDLLFIPSPWGHAGSADDPERDTISVTVGFEPPA